MNRKRQKKFADLLLDIAKYIITAVLLATWFSDVRDWEWYSYLIPVVVVVTITVGGLLLYQEDNQKKQKNNNYGSKHYVNSSACNGNCWSFLFSERR